MSQWTGLKSPGRVRDRFGEWNNDNNALSLNGLFATAPNDNTVEISIWKKSSVDSFFGGGTFRTPSVPTDSTAREYLVGSPSDPRTTFGFLFPTDITEYTLTEFQDGLAAICDGSLYLDNYDFGIDARSALVGYYAVAVLKHDGTTLYLDSIQVDLKYNPFAPPFTLPTASPSVFSATIDSEIETYDSPSISERGVVYSTSPNPTTSDTKVIASGTTIGEYSADLTGLTENTTYYVRSYVIDTGETYYSEEIEFTTRTIAFEEVNTPEIKGTSATVSATINANLGLNITERGFVYSTSPNPSITSNPIVVSGTEAGEFSTEITGLDPETEYFFRSYIKYTNSPEVTFLSPVVNFYTTSDINTPKTYFYKFFNPDGSYRGEFYGDFNFDVQETPVFTQSINGGRGDLSIKISGKGEEYQKYVSQGTDYIVQVWVRDKENSPLGEPIYTGFNIDNKFILSKEGFIDVDLLYISGEADMERKVLESALGTTRVSYWQVEPADIFKDILDKFALKGGLVTYTSGSIKEVGVPLSLTLQNNTILDSVKEVVKFLPTDWYWYIDGNNIFHLDRTDFSNIDHKLYIGKEINAGEFMLSFGSMVNGVYYHGGDTGSGNLYKKFVNSTSQNTFGVYDKIISDERVTVEATAQANAQRELQKGVTPIRYITAEIMDSNGSAGGYDIESLRVGQVISVEAPQIPTERTLWQNSAGTVGNMVWGLSFWGYDVFASLGVPFQIQKITYYGDRVVIEASDIIQDTATTIVQLEKRAKIQATLNSPDEPN